MLQCHIEAHLLASNLNYIVNVPSLHLATFLLHVVWAIIAWQKRLIVFYNNCSLAFKCLNSISFLKLLAIICFNASQVPIITAEEHLLLDVVVPLNHFPFLSAPAQVECRIYC